MKPSVFSTEISDLLPSAIGREQCMVVAMALAAQTPAEISEALLRTCTDAEIPPGHLLCLLIQFCAVRDLFCFFLGAGRFRLWLETHFFESLLPKPSQSVVDVDAVL